MRIVMMMTIAMMVLINNKEVNFIFLIHHRYYHHKQHHDHHHCRHDHHQDHDHHNYCSHHHHHRYHHHHDYDQVQQWEGVQPWHLGKVQHSKQPGQENMKNIRRRRKKYWNKSGEEGMLSLNDNRIKIVKNLLHLHCLLLKTFQEKKKAYLEKISE